MQTPPLCRVLHLGAKRRSYSPTQTPAAWSCSALERGLTWSVKPPCFSSVSSRRAGEEEEEERQLPRHHLDLDHSLHMSRQGSDSWKKHLYFTFPANMRTISVIETTVFAYFTKNHYHQQISKIVLKLTKIGFLILISFSFTVVVAFTIWENMGLTFTAVFTNSVALHRYHWRLRLYWKIYIRVQEVGLSN